MNLKIVMPYKTDEYEISWIELNTSIGNFVIQAGHAPTILLLSPEQKATFVLLNGKRESLIVQTGVAHIARESVTLLLHAQ